MFLNILFIYFFNLLFYFVYLQVENVKMLNKYNNNYSSGTLYLTATHLIFVGPDCKKETWVSFFKSFFFFCVNSDKFQILIKRLHLIEININIL